jgi:hypothetical protein
VGGADSSRPVGMPTKTRRSPAHLTAAVLRLDPAKLP